MDSYHLQKIRAFYRSRKRMPSYSELMAVVGFRSKNAVFKLVERCVQRQWLEKDATGKLLPGRHFHDLRMLADTITLDELLIRNKEATYLLKVNGDSMNEAGILPGDYLIVERGVTPRDGDIVIAQVDHEWTMKYFRRRGRKVFLEAANKHYQPIHPTQELQIAAVVRGVVRQYT
jgi:SOS-response transcriptional repressor LexA